MTRAFYAVGRPLTSHDDLLRPTHISSRWSRVLPVLLSSSLGLGLAKNDLGYITARLALHRLMAQDHFLV